MTDAALPDPLDELVSAVLDGEADPADEARVRTDPVLAARLAELADVAAAVGTAPPLPAEVAERSLAAALAAATARPTAPAAAGPAALEAPPRVLTRRTTRRTGAVMAAAAAAVLGAVGLVGLVGSGSGDDADLAGGAAPVSEQATGGGVDGSVLAEDAARVEPPGGGAGATGPATSASTTTGAAAPQRSAVLPDLGEVDDLDDLVAPWPQPGPAGPDEEAGPQPCDAEATTLAQAEPGLVGTRAETVATLRFGGRAAWLVALVQAGSLQPVEVLALADPDCGLLDRRTP